MRILGISLALVGMLFASGCPKGKNVGPAYTEEELAVDPVANFMLGINVLRSPNNRTGAVDYETALAYFQRSANLQGGTNAAFNAGWCAEQLGQNGEAERQYRSAFTLDPTSKPAMFSLTQILTDQNQGDAAAETFRSYLKTNPTDLEVRNELSSSLIDAKRYKEALTEIQAVLRKDSKNAQAYRNLSKLYFAQEHYSMSELCSEKALQLHDGDPSIYNNLGVTQLKVNNEPGAIERFKTAIKLDSKNFEANMNLGLIALNSGDFGLALGCFVAANEVRPDSIEAQLGLAVSYRGTKEYQKASKIYDSIIKKDSDNEHAYFNAATLQYKFNKDFDKALNYLQSYVDNHPVGPTHPVFQRMAVVKQSKAAEDERKRQEAERKRQEEERKRLQREQLANMSKLISDTQLLLEEYSWCLEGEGIDEISMILEQAQMVVEVKDEEMAADVQMMLDMYLPSLDGAVVACGEKPPEWEEDAESAESPEGATEAADGSDDTADTGEGAEEATDTPEEGDAEEGDAEEGDAEEGDAEEGIETPEGDNASASEEADLEAPADTEGVE